ncbi:MAG: hypothetical protein IT350_09630 [Deltaproteobacteria bacterium]|nr:hypothetical protein [Deltaproteobacteria bacterium]
MPRSEDGSTNHNHKQESKQSIAKNLSDMNDERFYEWLVNYIRTGEPEFSDYAPYRDSFRDFLPLLRRFAIEDSSLDRKFIKYLPSLFEQSSIVGSKTTVIRLMNVSENLQYAIAVDKAWNVIKKAERGELREIYDKVVQKWDEEFLDAFADFIVNIGKTKKVLSLAMWLLKNGKKEHVARSIRAACLTHSYSDCHKIFNAELFNICKGRFGESEYIEALAQLLNIILRYDIRSESQIERFIKGVFRLNWGTEYYAGFVKIIKLCGYIPHPALNVRVVNNKPNKVIVEYHGIGEKQIGQFVPDLDEDAENWVKKWMPQMPGREDAYGAP